MSDGQQRMLPGSLFLGRTSQIHLLKNYQRTCKICRIEMVSEFAALIFLVAKNGWLDGLRTQQ
jgi:hypothetical protein